MKKMFFCDIIHMNAWRGIFESIYHFIVTNVMNDIKQSNESFKGEKHGE